MDNGHLIIRSIKESDFNAIYKIAEDVGAGFTSLPKNKEVITRMINDAESSFTEKLSIMDRFYFFVLEDVNSKKIVGTSAIQASRAKPSTYYTYELSKDSQGEDFLKLTKNYNNCSVFLTLFAYADVTKKQSGRGKFASRARCLFVAEFPTLFEEGIIAELRGIVDENNTSPFWEAVGYKYLNINFEQANYQVAHYGSEAIAKHLPAEIKVDTLPESAQKAIGLINKKTLPALNILQKEGFSFQNNLDILDTGPILYNKKTELRSVKDSHKLKIKGIVENLENKNNSEKMMIANCSLNNFKVTIGKVQRMNEQVVIEKNIAHLLGVGVADFVRFATFY